MIFGNINSIEEFPFLEEKNALNMPKHMTWHLLKKEVMKLTGIDYL